VYLVPAEEEAAENGWRYAETTIRGDGSFELKHLAPGKYYLLVRKTSEQEPIENELGSAAWDPIERARLRREAQSPKQEIELHPCQQMDGYLLPTSRRN
jgi:hypothetical protein